MSSLAVIAAYLTLILQVIAAAAELGAPREVMDSVLPRYYDSRTNPVWDDAEILTRNLGLFNGFLAVGLALSLWGCLGGGGSVMFFLICTAIAGLFALLSIGWSRWFAAQLILPVLVFVFRWLA